MPANKKYLTQSAWHKFANIFNGLIGGYLLSQSFHILLGLFLEKTSVIILSVIGVMIIWPTFIILAFMIKPRWLCTLIYFGGSILISLIAYSL
ncbi:MAG: hypothetical protein MI810_10635 [Flavobacteriales bacterium]|jgi:hypothetical protein|nr:hypothetical protein [Flavobacteriales bacterium]